MEHGTTLLAILHIIVAILLITIVLLQDSKGGGMGGAFGGGGGSQTLFGATGAVNFLVKLTRTLAVIFMGTCIGLTLLLTRSNSHSVVDNMPASAPKSTNAALPPQPVTTGAGTTGVAPDTTGNTPVTAPTTSGSH